MKEGNNIKPVEVVTKDEIIKFNKEIEEWKPNVSYPHGHVIRYNPKRTNNSDADYAKRVGGFFNVTTLISYLCGNEEP